MKKGREFALFFESGYLYTVVVVSCVVVVVDGVSLSVVSNGINELAKNMGWVIDCFKIIYRYFPKSRVLIISHFK